MLTVYSIIAKIHEVSGLQKVLLDIHNGIRGIYSAKIVSFYPYDKIKAFINVPENEYLQISSLKELKDGFVITHERGICTKFCLYNYLRNLKIKHIHVQHSIFFDKRLFTIYPNHIVSISDAVTNNLTSYFKVSEKKITKIHNGIIDSFDEKKKNNQLEKDEIAIAYIARVDSNKRQLEVVRNLKKKLDNCIRIDFIGNGPLLDQLIEEVKGETNFRALGLREDVLDLLYYYDYVMLFSVKEGLPLSLTEAIMIGKPLIINNVGGNLELGIDKYNALVANRWEELIYTINSLKNISKENYTKLSHNSRKLFLKKFTYNMMINKYKDLIDIVNNYGS